MKSFRSLLALALLAALAVPAAASDRPAHGTSAEALRVARESRGHWRLGRLTVVRREGRSPRAEAELLVGDVPAARLRVDPGTGGFLAEDQRPRAGGGPVDPERLRPLVERSLSRVEVGTWAWPAERGRAWGVPLRWEGRVIGKLKIDARGGRVLPAGPHDDDDDG